MHVTEIGYGAFGGGGNKDAITSVVIPDSVTVIESSAFTGIDELTKVTLPDGLKKIPSGLFASCKKLTSVNLPASLEIIETQAFLGCSELTELTIPASLTSVKFMSAVLYEIDTDNRAFNSCGKLPIKTRQTIESWGYTSGFGL